MTECNGCGSCCDPVVLPYTQEEAQSFKIHPDDKQWTLHDLTPMSRRQAKAREPELVRRLTKLFKSGRLLEEPRYFSCRHFDPDSRSCSAYEHRPPTCRRFPWMAGRPIPGTPLPAACSFRADIGETPTTPSVKEDHAQHR